MDSAVHRLKAIEGMDDHLLGQLAQRNPTVLQLDLLTSVAAVRAFIDATSQRPVSHVIQQLDDATRAQYAFLEPTEAQMKILCSPGAVLEFISLSRQGNGESAPRKGDTNLIVNDPRENSVGRLL